MFENEEAEILNDSYHFLTNLLVKIYNSDRSFLVTEIPRDETDSPILFKRSETFHIILTNFEKINFFIVTFSGINLYEGNPCCYFDVRHHRSITNNRRESRINVNYQGVVTDIQKNSIVHILDISNSGVKIETKDNITSEFVDLIFEEENKMRIERSRVIWKRSSDDLKNYLYGLEFQEKSH